MRSIVGWLGACLFALTALPAPGLADEKESDLYDCGEAKCSEWAPKGENTCRTCDTVQCRKSPSGGELIVGNKKKTQCFEGHGSPPNDDELEK